MNNFGFLQSEWPQLFADAQKAEGLVIPDPRATCFYARRTLESTVAWLSTKAIPPSSSHTRPISAPSSMSLLSRTQLARKSSSKPS